MIGRTHVAFLATVLIGGANFIAVSFSNRELAPVFGAMLRFGLAAILLLLLARARGVKLPWGRAAVGAALYGVLSFGVGYALIYFSLVELEAGTASVIIATAPLFTLMIAAAVGQERISVRGVVGGVMAVAGIGVLSWNAIGGSLSIAHVAAAVVGTVSAAAGSVVAKRMQDVHPLAMNAVGMSAGAVFLVVASAALGEPWVLPREPVSIAAVAWLIIAGSIGLFQLVLYVVKRWTASAAVYTTAGMPVVAVALGALLLGQPATPMMLVGGAIVIAGVYVGPVTE